jgi:hypothetical protein
MITIETIILELDTAGLSEGTEVGEYWRGLCNFWDVVKYSNDPKFISIIENEIRSQHEWMKANFTWVEHAEYHCDKCGKGHSTYRELVWNEELDGNIND